MAPGKLVDQTKTHFVPKDIPFFTLTSPSVQVQAQMCESCGRIELRGDIEKLRSVLNK